MNISKKIMSAMPWSKAALLAGDIGGGGEGDVALIAHDPAATPPEPGAGLLASVAGKVAAGQERLAMELAASGKGRAEIFEALYDDLKERKAQAESQKPDISAKDVAAAVLAELRAGTPAPQAQAKAASPTPTSSTRQSRTQPRGRHSMSSTRRR